MPLIELEPVTVVVRTQLPVPLVEQLDALAERLGTRGRPETLRLAIETGVRALLRRRRRKR